MLKLLLKKQLTEIFRNYFYDPKKNRARSKAGIIGYILLFVAIMGGMLGGMFTALSLVLCAPLSAAEQKVISVHTTSVQMRHQKYGTFYASRNDQRQRIIYINSVRFECLHQAEKYIQQFHGLTFFGAKSDILFCISLLIFFL